ncbi:hypothetical protein BRARA_I00370 [Brassica rapa]|uniref:Cyclin-dependent kinase inhibitor n=1 Tax=Brassica campestris TaxID=3711 RepID=A0A397XVQ7_BRACM|nr:hypothetical protein BRARA_I00370 [Brassica rapa]CAG7859986.1 unnamed protein product [Brassica rapa]
MGKYIKKSKITGDIDSMEATEATSLGVRTRAAAKTLALKRLNSSSAPDSSCYLQLRSRRLEKPPSLAEPKQTPRQVKPGIKESGSKIDSVNSSVAGSGDECFCRENSPEFQTRQSTRESTPCNFVEDLEIIVTPGSSTRSMRTPTRDSTVPTIGELEEFFAYAEQQQQRLFMEKYNFDIVNDVPLTGGYEWVQVSP